MSPYVGNPLSLGGAECSERDESGEPDGRHAVVANEELTGEHQLLLVK